MSHGVGFVAAAIGAPFLIAHAARHGGTTAVVGASVFAATMLVLYLASTLYHALPPSAGKRVFRILEHSAIFLLIVGTYTPFTLGVLRGPWGTTLLASVWTLAAVGIVLKLVSSVRYTIVSTVLYVAMGWLVVVAIEPLSARVARPGLWWLIAGGLAYTVGVWFFSMKRLRYAHFIWHLFVLAGTACHFCAVLWYAA